jgi:LmbE family N-acetylglucosaminyl deacetylase
MTPYLVSGRSWTRSVFAGVRVEVLCLTHGQAWMLEGAPGDLAALRGAELA